MMPPPSSTPIVKVDLRLRDAGKQRYAVELDIDSPYSVAERALARVPALVIDHDALRAAWPDPRVYGSALSAMVFADAGLAQGWREARTEAGVIGARLRLRLHLDSEDPELHAIIWELLTDPESGLFLATDERVLLSRYLSSADGTRFERQPHEPRRALVLVAAPSDLQLYDLAPLDVDAEVARARSALGDLQVHVCAGASAATRANLSALLAGARSGYDIIYLVAHGAMPGGQSVLYLENDHGKTAPILGDELVGKLRQTAQRPMLMVLAACATGGDDDGGALSALGSRLLQSGVPAALVMRGSISIMAAGRMLPVFFRELRLDGSVDRALAVARAAARDLDDWWRPVLYTRLRDGLIWGAAPFHAGAPAGGAHPAAVAVRQSVGGASALDASHSPAQPYRPATLSGLELLTSVFRRARIHRRYCRALDKRLTGEEGVERAFSDLMAERSPLATSFQARQKVIPISSLAQDRSFTRLIILGDGGSGKTTALRHIALLQARRVLARGSRQIPVVAPLGMYEGGDLVAFLQELVRGTEPDLAALIPAYLERGWLSVHFDALNELPGDDYAGSVRRIVRFIEMYPRCQYLISSRSESYQGELGLERATILPLALEQMRDFLGRYLQADGQQLYEEIREGKYLELLRNPFYLWMVAKTGMPPRSKGRLIEGFVKNLLQRHAAKLGGVRMSKQPGEEALGGLLARLAYTMMQERRTTVISRAEAAIVLPADAGEDPITQGLDALLLRYVPSRSREITFWHQTIQEYFAASYLEQCFLQFDEARQSALCADQYWWGVLALLADLVAEPETYLRQILGDGKDETRVLLTAALLYSLDEPPEHMDRLVLPLLVHTCTSAELSRLKQTVAALVKVVGPGFLLRLIRDPAPLVELRRQAMPAEHLLAAVVSAGSKEIAVALLRLAERLAAQAEAWPMLPEVMPHLQSMGSVIIEPCLGALVELHSGRLNDHSEQGRHLLFAELQGCLAALGATTIDRFEALARDGTPARRRAFSSDRGRPSPSTASARLRVVCATVLVRMLHEPAAIRLLCSWITGDKDELHAIVKRGFAAASSRDVAFETARLLNSGDWRIRMAAADLLADIRHPLALESLEVAARFEFKGSVRAALQRAIEEQQARRASNGLVVPQPSSGLFRMISNKPGARAMWETEVAAAQAEVARSLEGILNGPYTQPSAALTSVSDEFDTASHLHELTIRIFRGAIGYWVCATIALLLLIPYAPLIGQLVGAEFAFSAENARVLIGVALTAGGLLGAPVVAYQTLAFIVPAMTNLERRWLYGALAVLVPAAVAMIALVMYRVHLMMLGIVPQQVDLASRLWLFGRVSVLLTLSVPGLGLVLAIRFAVRRRLIPDSLYVVLGMLFGPTFSALIGEEAMADLRFRTDQEELQKLLRSWVPKLALLALLAAVLVPLHWLFAVPAALALLFARLPLRLQLETLAATVRAPFALIDRASIARLRPGRSLREAFADLDIVLRRSAALALLAPFLLLGASLLLTGQAPWLLSAVFSVPPEALTAPVGALGLPLGALAGGLLLPAAAALVMSLALRWLLQAAATEQARLALLLPLLSLAPMLLTVYLAGLALAPSTSPTARVDLALAAGQLVAVLVVYTGMRYVLSAYGAEFSHRLLALAAAVVATLAVLLCSSALLPFLACAVGALLSAWLWLAVRVRL